MSIEFAANTSEELTSKAVADLKSGILARLPYGIVRESDLEFGLARTAQKAPARLEVVTISVSPRRVYIAFHLATRLERDAFLGVVRDELAGYELTTDFAEL